MFFAKAVQQDPGEAKTHYLLAQAHFGDGDFRNASLEIAEALKLNPTQSDFRYLHEQIERARAVKSQ